MVMRSAFALLFLVVAGCATRVGPEPSSPFRLCLLRGGELAEVDAEYRPRTGDTLVAGKPLARALSAAVHAGRAPWFLANETITFSGGHYILYGAPGRQPAGALLRVGEHRGVGVYVPAKGQDRSPHPAIYIPVGPTCEFQLYQSDSPGVAVPGG